MKGLTLLVVAVVVGGATAGCGGSSKPAAQPTLPTKAKLALDTSSTGGKALVLTSTLDQKLASQKKGHLYSVELQGIGASSGDASFDQPTYADPNRCVGGSTCEWTVVPPVKGTYEYRAVVSDLVHNDTVGQSNTVHASWSSPPRPRAIKLFVNGKTPRTVSLSEDNYGPFPSGPMQVEAKWLTDASGTGYYVTISIANEIYASCSSGTTCSVPKQVTLPPGTEVSWTVQLMTKKGNKVAGGFKVCLKGLTKPKST
jgi:hypothetical protein